MPFILNSSLKATFARFIIINGKRILAPYLVYVQQSTLGMLLVSLSRSYLIPVRDLDFIFSPVIRQVDVKKGERAAPSDDNG